MFQEKEGEVTGVDKRKQRIIGHLCVEIGVSSQRGAHNHFSRRTSRAIGSPWGP